MVTVSVKYPGASAEVVESQVSKPLEDSIAGIDAVDVITSISRAEQSQISVRFRLEKLVAEFDRISRLPEAFALDTVAETTKVFDTAARRLCQIH